MVTNISLFTFQWPQIDFHNVLDFSEEDHYCENKKIQISNQEAANN